MSREVLTPANVEKRLLSLYAALDSNQDELTEAEMHFHTIKAQCEIALASSRLRFRDGKRVQEIEDRATIACADVLMELAIAEAKAKAARANANKLKTQVDIVRSVGTSVRASMDLGQ